MKQTILSLLCLTLCQTAVFGGAGLAAPVTQVRVDITDSRGTTSQALLDKMAGSMQVVAEQLFNGRDSAAIAADREGYEHLLAEISDRVITGYQTNDVELRIADTPDGTTAIAGFSVSPWAQSCRRPTWTCSFPALTPRHRPC